MANIRLAARRLLRTPFITLIAVLSLALGIGANAAIFSVYDQVLLRPLPVVDADRLVNVEAPGPKPVAQSCNAAGPCTVVMSYPMFRDLQAAEGTGFSGLAGQRLVAANIAQGDRTVNAQGVVVSGSYFPVLGVRPALGRLLQPSDDEVPGENPVVVLSYRFWQNDLGGDPDVLNRPMVINGTNMTVVGVAPRGFYGTTLGAQPAVFIPLSMRDVVESWYGDITNRRFYWVYAFGRLEPGVSVEEASARINRAYTSILNEVEAPLQQGMSDQTMAEFRQKQLVLAPGQQGQSRVHDTARMPVLMLMGITVLVLLIACANIANLLLARGAARTTEMAVRGSMGATRNRLVGQLLTESLLLAGIGGLAGLVVARATMAGMAAILPPDQAAMLTLTLDPVVLAFTAAATVGTGILFGLYPAWSATRADLVTSLKNAAGQMAGARSAARFRSGLVTVQIALSMALLVAAGLFVRSLANVSRVDLGVRTDGVVTFALSPALNGYDGDRSTALFDRVHQELAAQPGVTGVAESVIPILAGSSSGNDVAVQGFQGGPDVDQNARYNILGPGFLRTLGIPLVAGREFEESDGPDAPRVAMVNEAFAEKFGLEPGEVVGTFMSMDRTASGADLDVEIVGLVRNAKYDDIKDESPPQFYIPYRQRPGLSFLTYYVRTGDPSALIRAVPGLVRGIDPNLPVEELMTLDRQASNTVFLDRFISILSTAFAVLATLLAAIGLYGVLAYTVAQRTREIGLRMALGADTAGVRRMVLRQVTRMLVVGGVLGIVAALALGRAAGSILYGLNGHDPLVLGSAVLLLAAVAFGAGYLPALRASRIDPMDALRYE